MTNRLLAVSQYENIPGIPGLTHDQAVTLAHCRSLKQFKDMIEAYKTGKCVFCDPLDPKNEVCQVIGTCRIWLNPFPFKHTQLHLVSAPLEHVEGFPSEEVLLDMARLLHWACKEYKIPGGGYVSRIGKPDWNAGSVLHYHGNVMVPSGVDEVRIPFAKTPADVTEGIARMHVFAQLCAGIPLTELSDVEQKLVEGRV